MAWKFSKPSTSRPPELYGGSSSAAPDAAQLPAVQRDFYLEHPDVSSLTPEQVQALRSQLSITIHGDAARCPNPVGSFVQASFPQYILDALLKVGFSAPTAIQRQGWPVAMKGIDVIGLAETGSGKTLTYLNPNPDPNPIHDPHPNPNPNPSPNPNLNPNPNPSPYP